MLEKQKEVSSPWGGSQDYTCPAGRDPWLHCDLGEGVMGPFIFQVSVPGTMMSISDWHVSFDGCV